MTDNVAQARKTYSISHWGDGYFDIDAKGHVDVRCQKGKPGSRLADVVRQAQSQGLALPLLLRFGGILSDRVSRLCAAFEQVIIDRQFQGCYTAVYPIKVNQQRHVVETLFDTTIQSDIATVGLEAGSKPELMAVLALSRQQSVIVCNGYKDREYIRLALIGEKLGRRVFIVIEKPGELQCILEEAKKLAVQPRLGLRVRLSSVGKGNWQNTGGEKSKFGLSAMQVMNVVEQLRAAGRLNILNMLHFHLGSQISNIRDIQKGMKEAARYFAALSEAGAALNTIDVGGGLGVDYEGTRSRSDCSINYSMEEYAYAIVNAVSDVCEQHQLPHPTLISESGRALTAHHAVLVTNVIGRESLLGFQFPTLDDSADVVLKELAMCWQQVNQNNPVRSLVELYHETLYRMEEINDMYIHGALSLNNKALGEQMYFAICEKIRSLLDVQQRNHQDIMDELNEKLADKVFLNFSLFQSLPDVWGIDQVFPIMPLQHLDKPLKCRGIIQDVTCDSDGRIDRYVNNGSLSSCLPMPDHKGDQPELLAIFMVGAYQEILGDMHNLFGDTDSVDVAFEGDGSFKLQHLMKGDSVDTILRYVNFDPTELLQMIHTQLLQSELPLSDQAMFLVELKEGLQGYTYLE